MHCVYPTCTFLGVFFTKEAIVSLVTDKSSYTSEVNNYLLIAFVTTGAKGF